MMAPTGKWVSIDFGTSNTAAAIDIDGSPHIVSYGNQQYFPTVACVLEDGSIEVCQNAEPFRQTNPETFKQEFKLQIADPIDINSATYEDIVAEILIFIKGCAELENNGEPIENAVLTIPALYTGTDARKTVMMQAAKRAGFKEVEFLTEPQAAALHYAQICGDGTRGLSLIYDLGGGTFDPALLEISGKTVKLLGHESGVKCGGHYFDRALYNHFAAEAKEAGTPLERRKKLEDYAACTRIKETLSIKETATQVFSDGKKHTADRGTLNSLVKESVKLTLQACDSLLSTAGKEWKDVRQVLLVGGSTAIPLIAEMLQQHTLSHGASDIKIIRNTKGEKGEYNHRFATCLGGIAGKILPPPPPEEKPGILEADGRTYQLKPGDNLIGRAEGMDFRFDDRTMSRHHFTVTVTKGIDGRLNYTVTTKSQTKATVINNMEALNLQFAPISRISAELLDGFTIMAGNTRFLFKKPKES